MFFLFLIFRCVLFEVIVCNMIGFRAGCFGSGFELLWRKRMKVEDAEQALGLCCALLCKIKSSPAPFFLLTCFLLKVEVGTHSEGWAAYSGKPRIAAGNDFLSRSLLYWQVSGMQRERERLWGGRSAVIGSNYSGGSVLIMNLVF